MSLTMDDFTLDPEDVPAVMRMLPSYRRGYLRTAYDTAPHADRGEVADVIDGWLRAYVPEHGLPTPEDVRTVARYYFPSM